MGRIAGARSRASASSSGTGSTPTTSRTSGASASASAPAPVPTSSARSSPRGSTNARTRSASPAAAASCFAATRSAVRANRSAIDDHPPRSLWRARDAAHELVVDRARDARVLLREHAVPEQHDGCPYGEVAVELDGERVHGHGPDDAARLAGDAHGGPDQVAPKAVGVADRHDPDPRLPLGGEAPTVACALADTEQASRCDVTRPAEDRLEAVLGRIRSERREAVERDAATSGIEAGARIAQSC